jgi:hypothetical protein
MGKGMHSNRFAGGTVVAAEPCVRTCDYALLCFTPASL